MFTGTEIQFFTLGIITAIAVIALIYYHKQIKFKTGTWITLIIGIILLLFAISWSWSSAIEGEPRSASMGLVVFGIPALILILIGRQLAVKGK